MQSAQKLDVNLSRLYGAVCFCIATHHSGSLVVGGECRSASAYDYTHTSLHTSLLDILQRYFVSRSSDTNDVHKNDAKLTSRVNTRNVVFLHG